MSIIEGNRYFEWEELCPAVLESTKSCRGKNVVASNNFIS